MAAAAPPPEVVVASRSGAAEGPLVEHTNATDFHRQLLEVLLDVNDIKTSLQQQGVTCHGLASEVSELRAEIRVATADTTAASTGLTDGVNSRVLTPRVASVGGSRGGFDAQAHPQAHAVNPLGQSGRAYSADGDDNAAVQAMVRREASAEARRLWAGLEKSRAQLDTRMEEMHGFLRAADNDHNSKMRGVHEWQEQADSRLAELTRELRLAGEASRSLERVKSLQGDLEVRLGQSSKRMEDHRRAVDDRITSEVKSLDERNARCNTELHRLIRGLDQRLLAAKKEKEDLAERCIAHADKNKAETEQRLEEDVSNLKDALQDERHTTVRDATDLEARVIQHTDEVCDELSRRIQENAAASAKRDSELAAQLKETSLRLDAAQARTEEVARHAEMRLQEMVRIACEALKSRFEAAMDEAAQNTERWKAECLDNFEKARRETAEACAELGAQSTHRTEQLRAETSERERQLRADLDRGVNTLKMSVASTREELQLALDREVGLARQEISSQASRQSGDLLALREALTGDLSMQARHISQLEARTDAGFKRASEDLAAALHTHAEQMKGTRDALDTELRGAISQAERRSLARIEDEAKRILALTTSLASLEAETGRVREQLQSAVSAARNLAGSAKEDAAKAQAQAQTAEDAAAAATACMVQMRSSAAEAEARGAERRAEDLQEVRTAAGSLAAGLVKVAQCCGLLGGLEEGHNEVSTDDATTLHLPAERVGLRELVDWERSGAPLATRVEKSWQARVGATARSLLGLVQQKADQATVRMVQHAVRELDKRGREQRVWSAPPTVPHRPATSPAPNVVGEPFVGSYGAQVPLSRRRSGEETPRQPGDFSTKFPPQPLDGVVAQAAGLVSEPPLHEVGAMSDELSATIAPSPHRPSRPAVNEGGPLKSRPLVSGRSSGASLSHDGS